MKLHLKNREVEAREEEPQRLLVEVGPDELRDAIESLWREYKGKAYLSLISVVDLVDEKVFRVDYMFWLIPEKKLLTIRVKVPRDNPKLPSIVGLVPAANVYEREAYDLFGIVFEGNPRLEESAFKPLDLRGQAPLRKDWKPTSS